MSRPSTPRLLLGTIGAAMICYGGWQIFNHSGATKPAKVGEWLIAALILHDGVLAWLVIAAGWLVARTARGRARAYLQGALICAALITVIALPLIYRRGKSAPGLTLLEQNYVAHLLLLLGILVAVVSAAYAVRTLRDATQRRSNANERPPADHSAPMR